MLLSLTLASCADNSNQDTKFKKRLQGNTMLQADKPKKLSHVATTLSNSDTLVVDKQVAVFIEPDSLEIAKRKKQAGEEDFNTGADDYLFYINTAYEFFDSVKLTTLNAKEKKFIKFVSNDKTQQVIKLDKLPEVSSIYFFDPIKKAKQVDMTTIDEEYKSYFK